MSTDRAVFINVSIRGRVAFGICCLENALTQLGYPLTEWQLVLAQLWKYTEQSMLDDWHEVTAEYVPEAVLEELPFDKKGNEYVSQELNAALGMLYRGVPRFIHELIDEIFWAGTIELYGALVNGGEQSLLHTLAMVKLMKDNTIPLPGYPAYTVFLELSGGWGKPFTREYLLSKLAQA
jgi:hypothetical protein